jgi:hypothetical protein
VDSKYRRINGLGIYPDAGGTEAIWIFKEDSVWTHDGGTGAAEEISLEEFRTIRSQYAGRDPLLLHLIPLGVADTSGSGARGTPRRRRSVRLRSGAGEGRCDEARERRDEVRRPRTAR